MKHNRRRRTREELNYLKIRIIWYAAIILWAVAIVAVLFFPAPEPLNKEYMEPADAVTTAEVVPAVEAPVAAEVVYLNCDTPASEPEPPYLREDIPLEPEMQALLYDACGETGVDYELALAVVRKETDYRNLIGDGGESFGYMQVQPRWHRDRMERLGVTDLMDPHGNFRVGCDYLAELLGKYELEAALTCYNTGSPGHTEYADIVIGYWEELS